MIKNDALLVKIIKEKIESKRKSRIKPRCAFDIDGTILEHSRRTQMILIDAARITGDIPEDIIKDIEAVDLDEYPYWIDHLLDKIGVNDPAIRSSFAREWDDRFFSDQYLWADNPIQGAAEFVTRLHESGVAITYLTGRHRNGMFHGTRASLVKHGFPFDDGDLGIIMKPLKEYSNAEYKRDAAEKLAGLNDIVAVFDNEPKELYNIACKIDEVAPVLYESPRSGDFPLDDRFFRIDNYLELLSVWN
jgi:predicted secreted acid phosphatase